MEDCNTIGADCIVISCCCQCLILQLIIFILLKLPYKLIRKTKQYYYTKKKQLKQRRSTKEEKIMMENHEMGSEQNNEVLGVFGESTRIQTDGSSNIEASHSCMKEVDRVLRELSEKGEFAFGSFWGSTRDSESFPECVQEKQEFIDKIVQFHMIKMVSI